VAEPTPSPRRGRISPLFMVLMIMAGLGIGLIVGVIVTSVLGYNFG
jgi:hypothetical protein